jgi:hypothetical protein
MSPIVSSLIVFACVFGVAVFGLFVRSVMPQEHLSTDSKGAVLLAMGMVATMSALVLGLLVSSAKSFFDTQSAEVTEISSKMVLLDRALALYGPEAKEARDVLRHAAVGTLDWMWPQERGRTSGGPPPLADTGALADKLQSLSLTDDKHRTIQAYALSLAEGLGETRWLIYSQKGAAVSKVMLGVLVFWIAALFFSFGLFSPRNATVTTALFISGLSVSGAIFLILEMYSPYGGLIAVSSAPMRAAVMLLGQ